MMDSTVQLVRGWGASFLGLPRGSTQQWRGAEEMGLGEAEVQGLAGPCSAQQPAGTESGLGPGLQPLTMNLGGGRGGGSHTTSWSHSVSAWLVRVCLPLGAVSTC